MKYRLTNAIILFFYLFISIVYLEILFKTRVLILTFDIQLMRAILFSAAYAIFIMFFLMFFKEKTTKRLLYAILSVVIFLFFNQEIYSSFVEGFYSISIAGDFTMGLSFFSDYLSALQVYHIFYFMPLILYYILRRYNLIKVDVEYILLKQPLVVLSVGFLLFFVSLQTIDEEIEDTGAQISYSEMDLYTYMYDAQSALKQFGLLTYTQRDFFSLFRTNPLSESEYEILLDDFFDEREYHYTNAYSRIFEGKNFILIMAESLDTFAINEELTPNLYHIKQNYTYFDNYYSPLYYRSTADTEFLTQTSIYPDKNVTLTMDAYLDNYFPYTLPRMFKERGYDTYSFHNYTDYFYPRTEFHTQTLGYDLYMGSDALGLLANPEDGQIIFNHTWQSDIALMELSVPHFIESDRFFVNYVTVSGHFRYTSDHEIAQLHADVVEQYELDNGIELPDEVFYYLAANIELDQAIGYLFDELDNAGKLEDTVIMIYGDHYAYGIDKDTIWEYDDMKEDFDDMDIHNVPMMIYSDSFLLQGTKSNYFSSVDILPTVANMFGLNLKYNKVFGRDALARIDNIVRFADMSFVSRDFSYDSLSEQYEILEDSITPDYLISLNHQMINEYFYNILVLEYDYFNEEDDEE